MQSHVKVEMTVGTLRSMTTEQFHALQDNILAEGKWETVVETPLHIDGGDYLGVYLPGIFIGIEKDGYTHS
jgi:hypothetical protein